MLGCRDPGVNRKGVNEQKPPCFLSFPPKNNVSSPTKGTDRTCNFLSTSLPVYLLYNSKATLKPDEEEDGGKKFDSHMSFFTAGGSEIQMGRYSYLFSLKERQRKQTAAALRDIPEFGGGEVPV